MVFGVELRKWNSGVFGVELRKWNSGVFDVELRGVELRGFWFGTEGFSGLKRSGPFVWN